MLGPKTFRGLRASAPVQPRGDEDAIERVMARLAAERDGQLLLTWLRAEAQAECPPNASDAILREAEGRRRAFNALAAMAE